VGVCLSRSELNTIRLAKSTVRPEYKRKRVRIGRHFIYYLRMSACHRKFGFTSSSSRTDGTEEQKWLARFSEKPSVEMSVNEGTEHNALHIRASRYMHCDRWRSGGL
jgi:hypothetical protein